VLLQPIVGLDIHWIVSMGFIGVVTLHRFPTVFTVCTAPTKNLGKFLVTNSTDESFGANSDVVYMSLPRPLRFVDDLRRLFEFGHVYLL
jgi:hypothetical protein